MKESKVESSAWCEKIITGTGGLHAWENHEGGVVSGDRDVAVARWVLRCLANPLCEGSKDVLTELVSVAAEHRVGARRLRRDVDP